MSITNAKDLYIILSERFSGVNEVVFEAIHSVGAILGGLIG